MEIKTKAYYPFRLDKVYDKAIVTYELHLRNNELIHFQPMPKNQDDLGFKNIERQEYTIKYLDADHKIFNYSNEYIEIRFKNNGKDASVYIDGTIEIRAKLKWIQFVSWVFKSDNSWKAFTLIITIILAIIGWIIKK